MTKATSAFVSHEDRFELEASSPAAYAGCIDFINPRDARLTVARDFYSRKRAPKPSAGHSSPSELPPSESLPFITLKRKTMNLLT